MYPIRVSEENIIKVLENAKESILNQSSEYLCFSIEDALHNNGILSFRRVSDIIPEFNRELAEDIVGTNKDFVLAWWGIEDKSSRIKFLDYLIDLYKKKL